MIKYKGTKKIWILIVLAVIAVAGWTWSYGYHNRKSNDNLPNLHDAKINFALSATPNVAGVAGDDYQNGFTK